MMCYKVINEKPLFFGLILVTLLTAVAIKSSCSIDWKYKYGARYQNRLQTTISADGQMVAAIQERLPEQSLFVRHLTNDSAWQKIHIPLNTKNIRFGLTGHELLIVFHKNETNTDVLAKLNLDKPDKPMEILHEDHYLSYPVEVSRGKIMLRTMAIDPKTKTLDKFSSEGILIEKNKLPVSLGKIDPFAAGTPSVVGAGFFYFMDPVLGIAVKKENSYIRGYALPDGKVPVIEESFVNAKTDRGLICDYQAERCLKNYITDPTASPYVYAQQVFLGRQRCSLPNAFGYFESESITPDGNAAVFAISGKPRLHSGKVPYVIVAYFKPQQCAPVSVQQLNLEE